MTFNRLKPFIVMLSLIMIAGLSFFLINLKNRESEKKNNEKSVSLVENNLDGFLKSFKYDFDTLKFYKTEVDILKSNKRISRIAIESVKKKYKDLIKKVIDHFADCDTKVTETALKQLSEFVDAASEQRKALDDIQTCKDFNINSLMSEIQEYCENKVLGKFNVLEWKNYKKEQLNKIQNAHICHCQSLRNKIRSKIESHQITHNQMKDIFEKIYSNLELDIENTFDLTNDDDIQYRKQKIKKDVIFDYSPDSYYYIKLKEVQFKTYSPNGWPQ